MLSGTRPTDKHKTLPLSFRAKRGICFFLMLNHKSRSLASLGMTSSGFFLCLLGEPGLSSDPLSRPGITKPLSCRRL